VDIREEARVLCPHGVAEGAPEHHEIQVQGLQCSNDKVYLGSLVDTISTCQFEIDTQDLVIRSIIG